MEPPQGLSALLTETTVLKTSITTSNGNIGGTTLIDSGLTEADGYWTGTVVILSGACKGQKKDISGFNQANNRITVGSAFDSRILSGVRYAILAFEPATVEVSILTGYVGYEGATSLADKLTSARAGYLDELDFDLDAREQDISFCTGDVYIDSATGSAGTAFPLGTPTHPVDNIANALTIAVARNLHHLHIHGTFGAITETLSNYLIRGVIGPLGSPLLTLVAGVANAGTIFRHCMISGTANGWATYEDNCLLIGLSGVQGLIRNCNLNGTIKLGSGITDFDGCTTVGGPITIDLDDIAAGTCIMHNIIGTVTLTNLDTAGTVKIYSSEGANITINASCTAGTINIYGNCNVTDNSAGSTVNDYTIYTRTKGLDDIHDDLVTVKAKSDLINSDSGSASITGTDSDTIIPSSLPTKMHLTLDISALVANGADNTIEIKVGVAASELVVAYYNLTGDGADITCDKGSGVGAIAKQRSIDISNIKVAAGQQVIIENTKNDVGGNLAIPYDYLCGA